jgi:hypothetical protein
MSKVIFPNNVEVIHTWRHGSKEWLIERGFTVGASEIGKALGVSPYGGLLSLVIDKRKARMGNPDVVSSEAMQDGQDAEATVLRMAWRRLQNIEGGICEATATPEMVPGYPIALGVVSATPDAVIIDAETVLSSLSPGTARKKESIVPADRQGQQNGRQVWCFFVVFFLHGDPAVRRGNTM